MPAKQANKSYIESTKLRIPSDLRTERKSIDLQKNRYSNQDWGSTSQNMITLLDTELKEPDTLLFFKGGIYQCTYNKDGCFSQSQLSLCYDVPQQQDLDRFRPIKMLLFPPTMKLDSFNFDHDKDKSYYIDELAFKEVSIGCSPERQVYQDITRAKREQYGLRHYVTGTIHSAMGDTYFSMAISISDIQKSLKLWDRGQLIVILSCTRIMKNTILVGHKNEAIHGLKLVLQKPTQRSDYMDQIINTIIV